MIRFIRSSSLPVAVFAALLLHAAAQTPRFNIIKPSTTGIPGEEMRVMAFDPAGNLWVVGRAPFWGEAGLAMLPADQLEHQPLPGGGFETKAWRVWSSVHYPIPSPYIFALAFGRDGTVWIGSEGGLTRFRPNAPNPADRWFTYTTGNSPLVRNEILSLAMDSQDNLWISNESSTQPGLGRLFKLNTASGVFTLIENGQRPRAVTIGNNDHVLISMTSSVGFMEFDGTSWTLHAGSVDNLNGLVQDAQGNVFGTTGNDGLWRWNGTSWRHWPTLGGTVTISGLGKDRDGTAYVSTWYGPVYKMVHDEPVFFADADNIPTRVMGRPNGDVWIQNYGGNGTLGTARHYTADGALLDRFNTYNSGLPDFFIDRIMHDSSGNMWFACGEGGLTRMLGSNGAREAATHWRNWGDHNDQSEPYPWAGNEPMYSMFDEGNGILWLGGNGLGRWDSNTGTFTNFWNWQNSNLDTSGIMAIAKHAGTIWVGTGGSGVYWLNGNTWTRVSLGISYSANDVKAMAVDPQDNLWVVSEFGLRKFVPGNNATFIRYDTSNTPLPDDSMTDIAADPSGGIWVATFDGLGHFDGTNWTTYTQENSGWPGPLVTGVARRADGAIAVATQQGSTYPYTGGVSVFKGTSWTHYTPDNSPLTHWQVADVDFDANGNLWASCTSEGVVQIMLGQADPPLQLGAAVSRKSHGSAGIFDVALPLAGVRGRECRNSGGGHTVVFTFSNEIASGTALVERGAGSVSGTPLISAKTMTLNLAGVADAQTLSLRVAGVTDEFGQLLPDVYLSFDLLSGDTNGDGSVNSSDFFQTRARSGSALDSVSFRSDVNADGFINAADSLIVRNSSGNSLP